MHSFNKKKWYYQFYPVFMPLLERCSKVLAVMVHVCLSHILFSFNNQSYAPVLTLNIANCGFYAQTSVPLVQMLLIFTQYF